MPTYVMMLSSILKLTALACIETPASVQKLITLAQSAPYISGTHTKFERNATDGSKDHITTTWP